METNAPTSVLRPRLPSFEQLVLWAFTIYKERFALIAAIAGVPFLFGLVQIFLPTPPAIPAFVYFLLELAALVVGLLSGLALVSAIVESGHTFESAFKKSWTLVLPYVWLGILSMLTIWGGLILLFLPGIYLAISLSFSIYVFFVEGERGFSALAKSWHYVKNYWWAVFGKLILLGAVIIFLSWLLLAISNPSATISVFQNSTPVENLSLMSQILNALFSNFIVLPLAILYSFGLYRALAEIKAGAEPSAEDSDRNKKILKAFAVIGAITLAGFLLFTGFFLKYAPYLRTL
jgi:hypothetical protein